MIYYILHRILYIYRSRVEDVTLLFVGRDGVEVG